jgi:ribulose-phosphate 3-epimerase
VSGVKIAPSILSADFGRLTEEVQRVEEAGADWIHVDVMDGHFVPNLSFGVVIAEAVRRATSLPLDVHLMIERPERYLADFAEAGATYLTVHQEACVHLHRTLQEIRDLRVKPGVALNPATPVETLTEVAGELDLLLVMSVNPGFGGQAYIEGSEAKVRRARDLVAATGGAALIQVDGGVGPGNVQRLVGAGADVVVAGSSIFRDPRGPREAMEGLRAAVVG